MHSQLLIILLSFFAFSAKAYQTQCQPCAGGNSYSVHLTFDDGPIGQTRTVLQTLNQQNVKATFFVVGRQVESNTTQNLALLREAYQAGHRIAWHTYSHPDLVSGFARGWSADKIHQEIGYGKTLIQTALSGEIIREKEMYIRCPEGQCWWRMKDPHLEQARQTILNTIQQSGFQHLGWDIDTYDWNTSFRAGAPGYILRQVCNHQGGVILMHDTISWTVENLNSLISSLRCSGHKVVDLPEVIQQAQKHGRKLLSLEPTVVGFKYCGHMNMQDGDQVRPDMQCTY